MKNRALVCLPFLIMLLGVWSASAQITGTVGSYSFEEGAGTTTADSSGNLNTGTLVNAPTWTAGKIGKALSFAGVSKPQYVSIGNGTSLRITGSLSIGAWIFVSSFPSDDGAIVSKRSSASSGYQLDVTPDTGPRTVGFKLTSSSNAKMMRYGATALRVNQWYHVVGVYDATGKTMNVYLNGQLDNGSLSGTITSAQIDSGENVDIGRKAGSTGFEFAGTIDEVRIFNRALSATDVQTLYNSGAGSGVSAPTITSATTASGTIGGAFSYQITATNAPTTYAASGLPAGLALNSGTGSVSGTPMAAGTTAVTLGATNSGGTGNASLALTVISAPSVTINQAPGQADPTNGSMINYVVVFGAAVTGFSNGGVRLGGSAGANLAVVTGSGATYNVAVSGMTQSGTVTASVAAGAATANGSLNAASTSTDNTVAYDITPPQPPSNLTATGTSGNVIGLSWTGSTDNVAVTGYLVERCLGLSCANFAQIATPAGTTFNDTGLAAGTSYSYRVRATDASGNLSSYSAAASATLAASSGTISFVQGNYFVTQSSPTGVAIRFTAAQSTGDLNVVAVGWNGGATPINTITDTSGNTYRPAVGPTSLGVTLSQAIYYARNIFPAAAGANTVTVNFASGAPIPDIRILEYSGADLNNPVDVSASGTGSGGTSSSSSVTTTNATDLLFGANIVTGTTAGAGSGFTRRILTTPAGDIAEDQTVTAVGSYSATAPASGQWIMQMVAFRTPVTGVADTIPPTAPGTLAATASSGSQINLSWAPSTDNVGVSQYLLERCQAAGCANFVQIGTSPGTTYSNTTLIANTSYSYRVRATDAAGNLSAYSPVASATTQASQDTQAPTAPGTLAATAISGSQINLSWAPSTDNVGVSQYLVERCQAAGCANFVQIGTSPGTTYNNTTLIANTSYSYRVRATDAAGNLSAYSPVTSATTQASQDTQAPTAPGTLTATAISGSQINLSWAPSTDNVGVTQYLVERCQGVGCTNFTEIGSSASKLSGPLSVSTTNPRYFVDATGKPLILSGSHTWNNLQDWGTNGTTQPMDFPAYVSFLASHGHNFTLLWRTELTDFCGLPSTASAPPSFVVAPQPWKRSGSGTASDGGPKFDLTQFDQSFFDRLRLRVQQLNAAGIYAGVYLFTGEWLNSFRCQGDGYPLTGSNNINGIDDGGGIGSVTMTAPNAITSVQDAFVDKMIDTLNDLPNVMWIVSEEAPASSAWWNNHVISQVRTYESAKPLRHPIGYAVLSDFADSTIYNSNADWVAPAAKISPTPTCGTGTPTCKVNINDSDHSYFGMWNDTTQTNRNYAWENFAGGNQVLFMDPYLVSYPRESRNMCGNPTNGICQTVDPRWNNFRDNLGYILTYSRKLNLANVSPRPNLSSTGYALAQTPATGAEYLVYAPNGGSFTVNLSATTRPLNVEWFNPSTGAVSAGGTLAGGSASQSFTPPFGGDAVLYLVDVAGHAALPGNASSTTFSDSALASNTSYGYRVRAADAAGNLSPYSNPASATTQTVQDTQAPTPPGTLTTTASASQISLSWVASTDNVGVTQYLVERCQGTACTNFVQIATLTGTTYTDGNGLLSNTTYGYRVRATDAPGNLSAYSNTATATMQTSTISVTLTPKRGGLTLSQSLNFTAIVVNDTGNAGVTWSVSSGLLSGQTKSSATYVAPLSAGVVTITATSIADSTKSASAALGVTDLAGVLTYHNDISRDGTDTKEFALTPSTVSSTTFGKLFSCSVDGQVPAQPLWVPNLMIGGGIHNVIFVATEHDSVYAFDADAAPCTQLWRQSMLSTTHGAASGATSVNPSDTGETGDITPEIGITGTPVVDALTNTLYVVSKTQEGTNYHQRLHALSLIDGTEKFSGPRDLTSAITVPGNADTGDSSVGCTSTPGHVPFCTLRENQRAGLALANGLVYVAWASHGDQQPYHGWIMSFSASNLSQVATFNDSPNGTEGGIWMAGGAPAIDSSNNLYAITGNGDFDGLTNFGDSFLKLTGGLTLNDWFTPSDESNLQAQDLDLGSGGAVVLVDLPSAPVQQLLIGGGKQGSGMPGEIYVLNRNKLGHFTSSDSGVVQKFPAGGRLFSTAGFWQNTLFIAGVNGALKAFLLNGSTGLFNTNATTQSSNTFGFPGATPAISSAGTANGIVWAIDTSTSGTNGASTGPAVLHAYDATNLGSELWNSTQAAGNRDQAGNAVKFCVPTIADGKVYIGTAAELTVYGLLPN